MVIVHEFGDKCVMVCSQAQVWHTYVGGDTPMIDVVKQLVGEKK